MGVQDMRWLMAVQTRGHGGGFGAPPLRPDPTPAAYRIL